MDRGDGYSRIARTARRREISQPISPDTDHRRNGAGYYRGEKLGFTVSQIIPVAEASGGEGGFELQEDRQLQMALLGAHTITTMRTTARVSRLFELQSFQFSLDPGTGPITIGGVIRNLDLQISITSGGRTRTEIRKLPEQPMLALNLVRRLAGAGLIPGSMHR